MQLTIENQCEPSIETIIDDATQQKVSIYGGDMKTIQVNSIGSVTVEIDEHNNLPKYSITKNNNTSSAKVRLFRMGGGTTGKISLGFI